MAHKVVGSQESSTSSPSGTGAGSLTLQKGKKGDGSLELPLLGKLTRTFGLRNFVGFGAPKTLLSEAGRELFKDAHFAGAEVPKEARSLGALFSGLDGASLVYLGRESLGFEEGEKDPVAAVLEASRFCPGCSVFILDDLGALSQSGPASKTGKGGPFPRVNSLHSIAKTLRPPCQFLVYGSLGLVVPEAQGLILSPVIYSLTVSALFDGRNLPVQDLISAESLIGNASPEEKAALHECAEKTSGSGLFGQYARLWQAIAFIGENKLADASRLYLELCQGGFPHWRVYWYLVATFRVLGQREHAKSVLEKLVTCAPEFEPARSLLETIRAEESAVPAGGNTPA